jgi:hypothetical protein
VFVDIIVEPVVVLLGDLFRGKFAVAAEALDNKLELRSIDIRVDQIVLTGLRVCHDSASSSDWVSFAKLLEPLPLVISDVTKDGFELLSWGKFFG